MILPGISDKDKHLRVLVEDLLYATIVRAPSEISMTRLLSIVCPVVLFVAEVILAGKVVGRILAGRVTGGRWRGRLAVIESWKQSETDDHKYPGQLVEISHAYGQRAQRNVGNPTNGPGRRMRRTDCYPRRST